MEQPIWYIHLVHFVSIVGLAYCSYTVGKTVGEKRNRGYNGED